MKKIFLLALCALFSVTMFAQKIFKDPAGDDNGPGTYTYPTDAVYKRGSFDFTEVKIKESATKIDIEITVNSVLEDPWRYGCGFSVQMLCVFFDYKEGGRTDCFPGLNIEFEQNSAWEKVVIISTLGAARVNSEKTKKAPKMAADIIAPIRVKGTGKKINATVDKAGFPDFDMSKPYGIQVIMQSSEGFPAENDLITRRVNQTEGQHRFGGGTDGDCDPHVMDILAGTASGDNSEINLQYQMLKYECNPDGSVKKLAKLKMIKK